MIKIFLLAASIFSASCTFAQECPQIDISKLDIDGVPFCPAEVESKNAWSVMKCAFYQAKVFHEATDEEKASLRAIFLAHKTTVEKGITKDNSAKLLAAADNLKLQVCRVKTAEDSYILAYTKPNIRVYSGPFLMLRELKPSKVIVMSPHDGTDMTDHDTKVAFQQSKALGMFSNGYKKNKEIDFLRNVKALGATGLRQMDEIFPKSVWLMIHGMKDSTKVLYRSRSKPLGAAYEEGIEKAMDISQFAPLNAGYPIDPFITSGLYLKTEIPVKMHHNREAALGRVVKTIETKGFAWGE